MRLARHVLNAVDGSWPKLFAPRRWFAPVVLDVFHLYRQVSLSNRSFTTEGGGGGGQKEDNEDSDRIHNDEQGRDDSDPG